MKKLFISALLLVVPAAFAQEKPKLRPGTYAHFETTMGNFTIELFERQAPRTVENFIGLVNGTKEWKDPRTGAAQNGKRFYDGLIFHRVINGFMIQGGDPLGSGTGGPGYVFADEFARDLKHNKEGVLSMANRGPNTNGSQFFITLAPTPHLDGMHSIFGQVVTGMDVVRAIGKTPVSNSKPSTPVVMKKITIERISATGD
jgi:cyclophilin family peptidyl-prolyl cis-trans isomerase